MSDDRVFARIASLFDVGAMSEARVLIAGCGSGGGQVALQLAMAGIRRFSLFDTDVLKIENVIRHVCGRRYLGWKKTEALSDVLLDRNPEIQIECHDVDLMKCDDLETHLRAVTVVVLATDNEPTRYRLNEACVKAKVPFVVGRVFTRGIGGEVFSYRPGSACLACLEGVLERTPFRAGVREIDLLSDDEREKVYGLEVSEIKDSPGLNLDISFVTSFHARLVLDAVARGMAEPPKYMQPIEEDYFIWGNRPTPPFTKHFQVQRMLIQRQNQCLVCSENHT